MTLPIQCTNYLRSLQILNHFIELGANNFVLCPGSRSAPLAIAAGDLFEKGKLNLYNSIDERSASFHALGMSSASGKITVVITTSGTAVANLLPAAVEADRSFQSIIFLTADRPFLLKNCGANQTVNQEDFLESVCRKKLITNKNGLHLSSDSEIEDLLQLISRVNYSSPGPIHMNIPFEKPLAISLEDRKIMYELFEEKYLYRNCNSQYVDDVQVGINELDEFNKKIDLDKPGIIIVGPYQGSSKNLRGFNIALNKLQNYTGWPIFADPISGLNPDIRGIVDNWELIIANKKEKIQCEQLLRLGPMSSSIYLEKFLISFEGSQFLIKENSMRKLDPVKKAIEYDFGLVKLIEYITSNLNDKFLHQRSLISLAIELIEEGKHISEILKKSFSEDSPITEYSLANKVPRIWPENYPIMLSASSPIRDWLTFSENKTLTRRCYSFRGASGIDGTLSLAMGVARVDSPLLLITGDLAFLHDLNGFLIEQSGDLRLIILLIDNKGGNIFNEMYSSNLTETQIKKLFIMPKTLNWERLSEAYNLPYRCVIDFKKLEEAFEWGLSMQKSVIIRVDIDVAYQLNVRELISKSLSSINQ